MARFKCGIALVALLFVVSAIVGPVMHATAPLHDDRGESGTPLHPFDVIALVHELAPGFKEELRPVAVRGVETHASWKGPWDRWVVVELATPDSVTALQNAVLERAREVALQKLDGRARAEIFDDRYDDTDSSEPAPQWWADSRTPDGSRAIISYAGDGASDAWTFSRSHRRVHLWCVR